MQEEKTKKSLEREEIFKDTNHNEKCINMKREDYKTNNMYEDTDINNVSNNTFNEISGKEKNQNNIEYNENVKSHNKTLKLSNEKNNLSSKEKENILHNGSGEINDYNKMKDKDIPGKDKNGKTDIDNDNNNNNNDKIKTSKKDLEKYFSKFGKIVDIYVSRNISNNKNKGFGFVSFEKQESMNKVLKEKLHIICGKEIVVDVASMRDDKYKHLFHMPSENYLMKNEKKDKRFMKNRNKTNFLKYPIYNNVNNISDISKIGYHNMMYPNVNNFPSTNYQPLAYQDFNMKASFRNVYSPVLYNPYVKPFNPTYKNSTPVVTNDYVYNLINYNIWNNVVPYNNNLYNSKKISLPNYYYNRPYPNQSKK
ncbi:hypothetical protein PFDG_04601 [Plasmodium falciparum Dd2]|uniref:RRM domain-containing protein n=1 Tax=Plasmodium falciparum (isolate Dd2) TaxID=57267 RepID=A0A0L7M5K7_PLAF4|nr:hypothetical protein PFDG_04601 [Plasmodium falciparum Dd2]